MSYIVNTYSRKALASIDAASMFQLRHEVFVTRLGWDVDARDGMETDRFDELEDVAYVLAKSQRGTLDACWRILPTTGPYMLRDTFPELLHGMPAPRSHDCWELSRFAVSASPSHSGNSAFGPLALQLMIESAIFARERAINRYVTVTTPAMERMLKHQGIHIHRIGAPLRIGVAMAVACMIEIDDVTLRAIGL